MTISMSGNLWRVQDPDKFEDWVAAVELAANQFKSKTGQTPTHINVLEANVAERLAEIYDSQGYRFILGSRLDNEVLVGTPQKDTEKGVDQLQRHRDQTQFEQTTVKELLQLTNEEEAKVEARMNAYLEGKNGVRPESEAGDKPVYDKPSNTVTYGGVRFLDVHPEDVMKLTKDPEHFAWMQEMYDWVDEGDKAA